MMIAFTQGLQGAGSVYGVINSFASSTTKPYSRYSIIQVGSPLEQGSFAHTMYEVRSERRANDSSSLKMMKTEEHRTKGNDQRKDQSNGQKGTNDVVNTQAKQNDAVKNERGFSHTKSIDEEGKKQKEKARDFAQRQRHARSGDVKTIAEHSTLREAHALRQQIEEKDVYNGVHDVDGRRSTQVTLEHVEGNEEKVAHYVETHTVSLGNGTENSSGIVSGVFHHPLSVCALEENNFESSSVMMQGWDEKKHLAKFVKETTEDVKVFEDEPFAGDVRRMVHGRYAQRTHVAQVRREIKEEYFATGGHDDLAHNDEGEQHSDLRVVEKTDISKNAKTAVRLEMQVSDDAGQKNHLSTSPSDMVLNSAYDKISTIRGASVAWSEKKGLRYLEQQGNQSLVQDAKFLFRGNSTGDIRLQLNPKELGEVKLMVKLDDNNLVHARAIVSSEEAKELMQKNLGNLAKQFGSEGYEIGSFSVSVNVEHSDTNDGRQALFDKQRPRSEEHVFVERMEQSMRAYVRISEVIDFVA